MEKDAHFGPKIKLLSNAFEQMLNQRLAAQNITSAQSYFLHSGICIKKNFRESRFTPRISQRLFS